MKKLMLLAVMALFIFNSNAQTDSICGLLPLKDGIVTFDNVVKVDNSDAKTLYQNSKVWIAKTFVSSKAVIDSDIENSFLSISAILVDNSISNYSFKMNIQFKDNRLKYTISNIVLHAKFSGGMKIDKPIEEIPAMNDCSSKVIGEINDKFMGLVNDLSKSLQQNDNNW